MNSKNFVIVILSVVIVILLAAIGSMAGRKSSEVAPAQQPVANTDVTPRESAKVTETETKPVSDAAAPAAPAKADIKTYTNADDCYTMEYDKDFKVFFKYVFANYDWNNPKFQNGNPAGILIKTEKAELPAGKDFDAMIAEANQNLDGSNYTKVESYELGAIRYANKSLDGKWTNFYTPAKDKKHYYVTYVAGINNDPELVNSMLVTLTPTLCR